MFDGLQILTPSSPSFMRGYISIKLCMPNLLGKRSMIIRMFFLFMQGYIFQNIHTSTSNNNNYTHTRTHTHTHTYIHIYIYIYIRACICIYRVYMDRSIWIIVLVDIYRLILVYYICHMSYVS